MKTKKLTTTEISGTILDPLTILENNILFERCLSLNSLYYSIKFGLDTSESTKLRQTTTSHKTPCETENSPV